MYLVVFLVKQGLHLLLTLTRQLRWTLIERLCHCLFMSASLRGRFIYLLPYEVTWIKLMQLVNYVQHLGSI